MRSLCVLVTAVAGCAGAIGDSEEPPEAPAPTAAPARPGAPANSPAPAAPAQATPEVFSGATLRRLTRLEYDNTLRDLLGDGTGPARAFPEEERVLGFDNHAEQVLCQSVPEPPPGVDNSLAPPKATDTGRDRAGELLSDAFCASCHRLMDPIGFAFERLDALGRWRDRDGGKAIDARGELIAADVAGPFDGVAELGGASRPARRRPPASPASGCASPWAAPSATATGPPWSAWPAPWPGPRPACASWWRRWSSPRRSPGWRCGDDRSTQVPARRGRRRPGPAAPSRATTRASWATTSSRCAPSSAGCWAARRRPRAATRPSSRRRWTTSASTSSSPR